MVVADIGGGSTELISARDGEMQAARSLPLGSGRLTDRFIVADPPRPDELVACETEASAVIQAAQPLACRPGMANRLIVVGGTGEFMARLIAERPAHRPAGGACRAGEAGHLSAAELADEIDIPRRGRGCFRLGLPLSPRSHPPRPGADRDLAKRDPGRIASRGALPMRSPPGDSATNAGGGDSGRAMTPARPRLNGERTGRRVFERR